MATVDPKGAKQAGSSAVSGAGNAALIGAAAHVSSIEARGLADGAPIAATVGTLKTITGSGTASVAGGAVVCDDASSAVYFVLTCDSGVQYMRALVSYAANATGTLALVIPDPAGTFPGMDGAGNPNAGVHCIFPCFTTVEVAQVGCGGYGPNAGVITGVNTASLMSVVPYRGYTREVELYLDKRSGRVTVQIDGITVVDYVDSRALTYVGKYAIFELYGTSSIKPKILLMEASSDARPMERDDIPRLKSQYTGSSASIGNGFADSPFSISAANSREGGTWATVSVWLDQTSGDTSFRFTDGTSYSNQGVVARGAFNGRVTFKERLDRAPAAGAPVKLQAMNTASAASFGAGSSVGFQQIGSFAAARMV